MRALWKMDLSICVVVKTEWCCVLLCHSMEYPGGGEDSSAAAAHSVINGLSKRFT